MKTGIAIASPMPFSLFQVNCKGHALPFKLNIIPLKSLTRQIVLISYVLSYMLVQCFKNILLV